MPRFEPKTFSYFLRRMANRIVARSELTDLEEGGPLHTIISAFARELDDISVQMVRLRSVWNIDEAEGEDLDERAADFNPDKIARRPATYATAPVVFSRSGTVGEVVIPAGTVVRVPNGGPRYATAAPATIANGSSSSAPVTAVALVAGSGGSTAAGTITAMSGVAGVSSVTNPSPALGQDEETDAEFRARLKRYARSLARGTPMALEYAALSVSVEGVGRVVSAEAVELDGALAGTTYLYIDDGAGTVEQTSNNYGDPEVVVPAATGGERRAYLGRRPIRMGLPVNIALNGTPLVEGVDYRLNRATGQLTLTAPLTAGDEVTAEYTWYTGLIAEVQRVIDGDRNDRANYPGYRAAGRPVFVLAPTVTQLIVEGVLTIRPDRVGDAPAIRLAVAQAIARYVNSLPIAGDVVHSELVYHAQSIDGVDDIVITQPPGNVVRGDGELARVRIENIDLT